MVETLWIHSAARIEKSSLGAYLDWREVGEAGPFDDSDAL